MNTPDRFHVCWPFTLAQECPEPDDWSDPRNFSDAAHDPGGATMCGITQREYDIYRKSQGKPSQSVRLISRDEGEEIYEGSYWLPECPKLPSGLDLCFFDEAVNAGPYAATRILQRALGIDADGVWGAETALAVRGVSDVAGTIDTFTTAREAYYRALSGFKYFGNGWLRRATAIKSAALQMAAAT